MDSTQYPDEQQYLAETVEFIDNEVQKLKDRLPETETVIHPETAETLKKMNDERLARYQQARSRPYFGRVDFVWEDGTEINGYIGHTLIEGHVLSWESSFAKHLFYPNPKKVDSYEVEDKRRRTTYTNRGRIILKRQYTIENAHLLDVTEVYRLLPLKDPWDEDSKE